ncbi:MAG: PAS domain S-box protein [Flavobacteriaceae bacterium]|nr:PAS domain S-box protein [Flavobacteriaceae bacterium]
MNSIAYNQLLILLLQTLIVAGLIIALFRLRTIFGLGLLYTALGVFQFIQVFLSSSIYFEVVNGIFVTPGNIVFTGSLFAILLVYIREDALEARKIIYAILAANLVMSFMQIVISWGIDNDGIKNIYNLPIEFFTQQSRVVIVGTLVLFLDVFAIIFLYEIISKKVSLLFLGIFLTMILVLTIDTLLFSFGVFVGSKMFLGSFFASLISKYAAAFIFSLIFSFYLHHFDRLIAINETNSDAFKDIFFKLTYRQKYEQVSNQNILLYEQLKESEIQFRSIFEKSRNVIYVISLEGKLISINPAFEILTGWSISDSINKLFTQLVHPDDFDLAMSAFLNTIEGKEVKPYELRILCKSGEYIFGEFTPSLLKIKTKNIGVLGIVTDITERKKAETEIQAKHKLVVDTLESMSDAFVSLDKNWCYTYMNEKAGKIFNRDPKQLIGKNIWTEFPDGVGQPFQLNYEKAMTERVFIQMEEYYEPYNLWFENRINPTEDGIAIFFQNITERKLGEENLRLSNQTIRNIIDYSPALIYIFNLNGEFILVNHKFEKLLGVSQEALLGQTREKYFPKEIAQQHRNNDLKVINTKQILFFEEENIESDGKHFYLTSKFPLFDAKGEIYAVGGISTDITERKIAEEKIKRNEKLLKLFIEHSLASIAMFDKEMNYIIASNRFKIDYDLGDINVVGRSHYEIFPQIPEHWKAIHQRGLAGETLKKEEDQYLRPDGQIDWTRWEIRPWYENDQEIGGIILFTEVITNRKNAEKTLRESEIHFRQLFENNPLPMWIYDLESLQFKDVNETAVKKYGYSKKEFLSMTLKDIRPVEEVSSLLKNIAESTSKYQESGAWQHQLKDGNTIFVEINSHDILFENKPARLVLINDITDRKKTDIELKKYRLHLEELVKERTAELEQSEEALLNIVDDLNLKQAQLEISNKKLAAINAEMETFTYSVSHDLKAPLRGIDGYSNLLQELYTAELNDEAKTFVNNIRKGTQQMNQIIEDLLAYSRLDRSLIKKSTLDINIYIHNIINLYQKELTDANFEVQINIPSVLIDADLDGLSIAFRNIVENAIKFTKFVEYPKITIELNDHHNTWHLIVTDNGIGFDMKYYDKIFQIFQRLHRVEDYPGTGIGLAMVQKAMQRMGGNVWATSELGKGATFYIEIPKNN